VQSSAVQCSAVQCNAMHLQEFFTGNASIRLHRLWSAAECTLSYTCGVLTRSAALPQTDCAR
jgi:hypothetical protein